MKKIITKADIRQQMESQIDDFLSDGGEVAQIQQGISGRENAAGPLPGNGFVQQPKTGRTYVPEVTAALDARRQTPKPKPASKKTSRPKKKMIYDDFGEPLRWEWVDE